MIIKDYGVDYATGEEFKCQGMNYSLNSEEVTDVENPINKETYTKTHEDGWTITGMVFEDYFTWVEDFEAVHPVYGKVWGDFEVCIFADSEEGYNHFVENHPPHLWDGDDI